MDWDYLDVMDKNLLYTYAKGLGTGTKKVNYARQLFDCAFLEEYYSHDTYEYILAEKWCRAAFYLIWFVFRYVLECKTLEEAEKYATTDTLKLYNLHSFFRQRHIYLGVYGIGEVYLCECENDISVVLEILYNRYNFIEELECFIRRSENNNSVKITRNNTKQPYTITRGNLKKCKRSLKKYIEMMENCPSCRQMVKEYNERAGIKK